jgi:hypothetical protein
LLMSGRGYVAALMVIFRQGSVFRPQFSRAQISDYSPKGSHITNLFCWVGLRARLDSQFVSVAYLCAIDLPAPGLWGPKTRLTWWCLKTLTVSMTP